MSAFCVGKVWWHGGRTLVQSVNFEKTCNHAKLHNFVSLGLRGLFNSVKIACTKIAHAIEYLRGIDFFRTHLEVPMSSSFIFFIQQIANPLVNIRPLFDLFGPAEFYYNKSFVTSNITGFTPHGHGFKGSSENVRTISSAFFICHCSNIDKWGHWLKVIVFKKIKKIQPHLLAWGYHLKDTFLGWLPLRLWYGKLCIHSIIHVEKKLYLYYLLLHVHRIPEVPASSSSKIVPVIISNLFAYSHD